MTAEEKLKELYKLISIPGTEVSRHVVVVAPEYIDLIANLVVERLRDSNKVGIDD